MDGAGDAGADRRAAGRAAHEGRDRRRDGRRGAGDARAHGAASPFAGGSDASTPAAPAATARGRSTSRRSRRSSWPAPAWSSPSTATARSRRARARPTCSRRWASTRRRAPRWRRAACARRSWPFCSRPRTTRRRATSAAPRKELGVRTIFNLLGPLTNPCGARFHVIGIFSRERCESLADALGALGSERALVVHGAGGLDEFAPAGEHPRRRAGDGAVRTLRARARRLRARRERSGRPARRRAGRQRAHRARDAGGGGPRGGRSATLMTAGAALYVAGARDRSARRHAPTARQVLTGGAAGWPLLETLRRIAPRRARLGTAGPRRSSTTS